MTKARIAVYFCSFLLIFLIFVILFAFVFPGSLILPQSFRLGPLTIHYYGIIMALAVAAGFYFAVKRSDLYGLNSKLAEDVLFWTIIGGFIGARLYHVLSSIGYYRLYPIDAFKVWNGGLSIYGAVLGGILTLWILRRIFNFSAGGGSAFGGQFSIFNLLDWLAPCVLLGQIIGRFGNLFNYEAYGYPTDLPWKMFVPLNFRPFAYEKFNFFHPFFLYELLGNLVILFILLRFLEPKYKKSYPGHLVFFYVLLYNLLRFFLEFLRIDSTMLGGFRLNAIVSLILFVIAALALIFIDKSDKI